MYKKIIAAVDDSETAKRVLAEAENIANTYNAKLRIVHSIVHSIDGDMEADKKTGMKILEQAESSVATPNIEARLLVAETGFGVIGITEAIAAAVAEWEAGELVCSGGKPIDPDA